jgi:hypothetical protein
LMDRFVEECRKEWDRLGVPTAVSGEMAADLAADLADAAADGVSPEEVLGNGVFDARAFAASWAEARGLVADKGAGRARMRWPRGTLVLCAAISLLAVLAGLLMVGSRQGASVATAFVRPGLNWPVNGPVLPPVFRIGPHVPAHVVVLRAVGPPGVGAALVLAGLVGIAVTLWLWKPWATYRRRRVIEDNVGTPSYL